MGNEIVTNLSETKLNLFKNKKIQNKAKVGRLKITKKRKNCTWLKKSSIWQYFLKGHSISLLILIIYFLHYFMELTEIPRAFPVFPPFKTGEDGGGDENIA